MLSLPQSKIVILGQTPSKKNSKQIRKNWRTGQRFIGSSDIAKDWQLDALTQLQQEHRRFNKGRIQIDYMFYVKDDVARDLDNMIASVNDVLQEANALMTMKNGKPKVLKGTGIIYGDHWQRLRLGSADAEIDRKNPRAEIFITELD